MTVTPTVDGAYHVIACTNAIYVGLHNCGKNQGNDLTFTVAQGGSSASLTKTESKDSNEFIANIGGSSYAGRLRF